MNKWPNWVDLIIVTIIFRTCYSGYAKGLLAELFHVCGAITVTVLTINYSSFLTAWLRPWISWANPTIAACAVFWVMLLGLTLLSHQLLKLLSALVKWEPVNWFLQGLAMALGGVRGLWWSGFLLLVFVSSGLTYLKESVEDRSVLGPKLVSVSHDYLESVADMFPGAAHRSKTFIPPLRQAAD